MTNLNSLFIDYCQKNNFEVNQNQIDVISIFYKFYKDNLDQSFFNFFFKKNRKNLGIYLHGDVGVGKTMLLNFFFDQLSLKKQRLHFNEFMIKFHDFKFSNPNQQNIIEVFVKELKEKTTLIYFDEFQVTNIVDAMILGRLFKEIFKQQIFVLFSSNIKINDLYQEGLQRDQFIPFLEIIKKFCIEINLSINHDYRLKKGKTERFVFPINSTNKFIANKFFREISKNKKSENKILNIKGRNFEIKNFFEGLARFDFTELCDQNIGAEDFIEVANNCSFIFIENLPDFSENNSNQQHRFITLVDILYEKRIPLFITSEKSLNKINSSTSLKEPFKRTLSRLNELTSITF